MLSLNVTTFIAEIKRNAKELILNNEQERKRVLWGSAGCDVVGDDRRMVYGEYNFINLWSGSYLLSQTSLEE